MARIQTRKGKKKTTFTITVRVKGYKSVSRTFDTKGEARTWASEIEAEMKKHRFKDPRQANVTFLDAMERYLATVTVQKALTTQERERRVAKTLLKNLGEDSMLPEITPAIVANYRDQRMKVVSAYSVRLELALLSHLFIKARKEWELPIENPVNAIERPKVPKGRIIFLKEKEAIRLLKECRDSKNKMLYPYILTLLHTAMRPSEAAGLRWRQIDLNNRSLTLFVTKNDPRTVPLTKPVVEAIQDLKNDNGENEFVFLKTAGKSAQAKNIPSSRFKAFI